jgi:hypothetical protein
VLLIHKLLKDGKADQQQSINVHGGQNPGWTKKNRCKANSSQISTFKKCLQITCSSYNSWIHSIARDPISLESFGKFQNKKHVGQLRLTEGLGLAESFLLVEVRL